MSDKIKQHQNKDEPSLCLLLRLWPVRQHLPGPFCCPTERIPKRPHKRGIKLYLQADRFRRETPTAGSVLKHIVPHPIILAEIGLHPYPFRRSDGIIWDDRSPSFSTRTAALAQAKRLSDDLIRTEFNEPDDARWGPEAGVWLATSRPRIGLKGGVAWHAKATG